ncbi:RHS repeat-associated core domain-containing protein [Sphingomonas sp. So64.6b]|uniref:RHS repeat domain-containing protein n=1 Tax=Sphingomonas sp. So64.6b TaxID=2997354 RepID=UPI0016048FF3|nr:RHS repeat-associated core domain-containing protein [Sphingomonas sp. So64.6b]QNA84063.1 RHS repeat-associated core domain-containing protein [Sphingomonas sp. So64.6b]
MSNSASVEGRRVRARLVLLTFSTALCTGLAAPALGQTNPPLHRNLDANGVDLTLGDYVMTFREGSIGSGDAELALIRQNTGDRHSQWDGYTFDRRVVGSTVTTWIGLPGQKADQFVGSSSTSATGTGATLAVGSDPAYIYSYIYTASDGTKITFVDAWGTDGVPTNFCPSNGASCSLVPVLITRPDGVTITLAHQVRQVSSNNFTWRLISITNSQGYAIKFAYQTNMPLSGPPPVGWFTRTNARFFNNPVSTTVPQATISYAYPASGTVDITDMAGNVWQVASGSIKRPGEAAPSFSVTGGTAVTAVTRDGVTTGYSRVVSGTTATMTVTDALSQPTVVVSDLTIGQPTGVTNALGKTTSFTYDSYGRLTRVTQPEGNYAELTLDDRSNVTATRQVPKGGPSGPGNIRTFATYPSTCDNPKTCNSPTSVTDALGKVTDYTYDPTSGKVATITAPAPTVGAVRPQTRYSYTVLGGVSQLTGMSVCQTSASCVGAADEVKTTIGYDAYGNVTSVAQGAGDASLTATTIATYNAMGDLATIDGPLSGTADTTTFRYDAARRRVGTIAADPDGAGVLKRRAEKITYDGAGRPTVSEIGTVAGVTDTDWTGFLSTQQLTGSYVSGRKVKDVLTASGTTYSVTEYGYDALGRSLCSAQRMDAASWGTALTSTCTPFITTGPNADQITKTSYDAAGRVTKTQSAVGTGAAADDATATYTDNGRVMTLTDAEANKTTYEYDSYDRLLKTRYPVITAGSGTSSTTDYEQLGYNKNGNVTSRQLRDGTSIAFTYDALGRVTNKDLPASEADITYSYDLLGRLTGSGSTAQTLAFSYDALGRNLTQSGPVGTVSSQYDLAGRRTRLTWPDTFYANYDYDVTGNVTAVRENGATSGVGLLALYTYDDLGQRLNLTRGNGTSTTYTPDPISRLSTLTHNLTGTAGDLTLGFAYNPASQIKGTTRSNDGYAWTGSVNVDRPYTLNGLNQATMAGSTTLGYNDGRGNLTNSGTTSYAYTSENLLQSSSGNAFYYDPLKRLFQINDTTRFGYDGVDLIGEWNPIGGALQKRYVHGPGSDDPLVWYEGASTSDRRWLHSDERGSVISVTDGSGAVIGTNTYDEYGIPGLGNIGRFQYTGQTWLPEIGLYYYKARLYSATLGRFMQADPIGYDAGMNWYNYVGGDPINFSDPTGLQCYLVDGGGYTTSDDVNGTVVHKIRLTICFNGGSVVTPSWNGQGGGSVSQGEGPGTDPIICSKMQKAVDDSKKDLPKFITDNWRWGNSSALSNDIVQSQLNLADVNDISLGLNIVQGVGLALSLKSSSPVGRIAGGAMFGAATFVSGLGLSAQQAKYSNQIVALKARLLQLQGQKDGICKK